MITQNVVGCLACIKFQEAICLNTGGEWLDFECSSQNWFCAPVIFSECTESAHGRKITGAAEPQLMETSEQYWCHVVFIKFRRNVRDVATFKWPWKAMSIVNFLIFVIFSSKFCPKLRVDWSHFWNGYVWYWSQNYIGSTLPIKGYTPQLSETGDSCFFLLFHCTAIYTLFSVRRDGKLQLNFAIFRPYGRKIANYYTWFPSLRTENNTNLTLNPNIFVLTVDTHNNFFPNL